MQLRKLWTFIHLVFLKRSFMWPKKAATAATHRIVPKDHFKMVIFSLPWNAEPHICVYSCCFWPSSHHFEGGSSQILGSFLFLKWSRAAIRRSRRDAFYVFLQRFLQLFIVRRFYYILVFWHFETISID